MDGEDRLGRRTGDDRLLAVFDDLEQQAEGLALSARDVEVAELGRAEYAAVDLVARLAGSTGTDVRLEVRGIGRVAGRLARVGADWLLVEDEVHEWLVRVAAVAEVRGLGDLAVAPENRPVAARLGFGSALRGIAEERTAVLLHRVDGGIVRGVLRRVGADFAEVLEEDQGVTLLAWRTIAGLRRG